MKDIKNIFLELYNDRKQIGFLFSIALLDYLTKDISTGNIDVYQATMGWIAVGSAVLSAGVGIYSANKNAGIAGTAATNAKIERDKQQALLEEQKEEYKAMEFKNPYENIQTQFENVFEDLTVNQQQARFQAQQGSQQRVDIMQQMQGAAGGSGIAGLAQMLANQGQLQTQQISASIGQQEAMNQKLRAQGAMRVQQLEQRAEFQVGTGEQTLQQLEADRQATLLGMQMGTTSGANVGYAQAQANQMQAQMAQNEAWASGISGVATTLASADLGGESNFSTYKKANPGATRSDFKAWKKSTPNWEKKLGEY